MTFQSRMPEWGSVKAVGGDRALPVYLLLDTSGSMDGAPIQAVNQGLELFQREVAGDQFARDIVKVGLVTFNSDAQLVSGGLVPIRQFQPPTLAASGVTRLDLAFTVLLTSMDRDITRAVKGGQKGDWKPAVFILTDGLPTDANGNLNDRLWRTARDAVLNRPTGQIKPSTMVAVGCGPHVDDATLQAMATSRFFHIDSDQAAFVALFQYLSQSLGMSVQPGGNLDDPFANIPANLDDLPIP